MKPKFRLEDYEGSYVMHCVEEWQAEKFCEFLHKKGKVWSTKLEYIKDSRWNTDRDQTCYAFNIGTYSTYSHYHNYTDFTILNFDDFDWSDGMEMKQLKRLDGTVMYYRETEDGVVEVEKPNNTRFIPKMNEFYWCYSELRDEACRMQFRNKDVDKRLLMYNNCFRTKEEANRKKEIFDFINKKRKYFTIKEIKSPNTNKYSVFCNHITDDLFVGSIVDIFSFATSEVVQEVIDFVGYDDWLKYVLGIYEE